MSAQQENHSDPIACLETNLEKQLEKNHEYRERSNAMKSQLDTLKKVQFFSRERLQGEFLFRHQTGEELQLKRGKIFLLEKGSVFIIGKGVFLTQEAKHSLLKAGEDFLLDRGRVFLSQIEEVFLSEQGEIFLGRQGDVFQSTKKIFFLPDKNTLFRSNKVKGFISEERAASLEAAVKKMLINFLIKEISLIEDNTKNDKQIKSLEEQLEKFNNKNQNKDQITERVLKEMIRGCKEENDRYQTWNNNWLSVQNFLESSVFFNPKKLLDKLTRDNDHLKIDREKKIEMIKSLEKQLEQITQKDI